MPTLTSGNYGYTGSVTISKQSGTLLSLQTNGTYADKDIWFTLGVQSAAETANEASADADVVSSSVAGATDISGSISVKSTTAPESGYYFKVNASGSGSSKVTSSGWLNEGALTAAYASKSLYFPVDAGTATVSGTNVVTPSASITGSNVTLSNVDNGVSVTAIGGGTASVTATVTGDMAGYISSGQTITSNTLAAERLTTNTSSFISGVTIEKPQSGTRSFSITVPNGSSTATFVFHVDSEGNVTVSET